jgi:hypothetical protein
MRNFTEQGGGGTAIATKVEVLVSASHPARKERQQRFWRWTHQAGALGAVLRSALGTLRPNSGAQDLVRYSGVQQTCAGTLRLPAIGTTRTRRDVRVTVAIRGKQTFNRSRESPCWIKTSVLSLSSRHRPSSAPHKGLECRQRRFPGHAVAIQPP